MLPYNKNLTPLAKKLRKNMTPYERRLWYDFLSKHPVKFYRQKPIDEFIVDFYCCEAKLVIEIDGGQHYIESCAIKDEKRTEILKSLGLEVIRVSNLDIHNNFGGVCEMIDGVLGERLLSFETSL